MTSILSCLFVYPIIHESGHLLPAVATGAEVNEVVWSPLIGRTHVSLNNVSRAAMPCVDAGGVLLPTLVGTLLIAILLWLPSRRPMSLWRLGLLIPGGVLLLGNLGLLFEAILPSNHIDHMERLAQRVAGDGGLGLLVELTPALWSCLVIVAVIRYLKSRNVSANASASTAG